MVPAAVLLVLTVLSSFGAPAPLPAAAAPSGSASRFGVVADIGTRHPCDGQQGGPVGVLADTKVKWVLEEFRWEWVEPSQGNFTWTCMDRAIDDERARGLDIVGQLDYTAGWAAGSSAPISYNPPPLDLWQRYVTQTVTRYKDRVSAWQVWNEPNNPTFWTGTKEQYAQLLQVTYDTIKRIDPGAKVLGPAITGVDESWLDAMPWDKFDVLALHMYVPPAFLNDQGYSYYAQGLPNLKSLVARRGTKPIWITEFGYSSAQGAQPWYVGDEKLQARYLTAYIAETLAYPGLNIERVLPYALNDDAPGGGFGLTRHDWSSRKPAYDAYRTVIERLDGATPRGKTQVGVNAFAFRFDRDGKRIDVAWGANGATATIAANSDAEVYDLAGTRRSVARKGNLLQIPLTDDPVYIVYTAPASAGRPPRFSQQQQAIFARNSRLLYQQALALATLDKRCGTNCKMRPFLRTASAASALNAARLYHLSIGGRPIRATAYGKEPPEDDSDYHSLASAEPAPVPPVTVEQGFTQQEASAMNDELQNLSQQVATGEAVDTSLARADAAHAAGDEAAEARQVQNAQQLAGQEAALINQEPQKRNELTRAQPSSGVEQSFSSNDAADLSSNVAQNGLEPEYSQTLTSLGANRTTQEEVRQALGQTSASDTAALGGGRYPLLMADPKLTEQLPDGAHALAGFSASQCFVKTGACVSQRFAAYWNANGGLAISGYPISELFSEQLEDGKTYEVQYFERARFEAHPENPAPYDVLLGQFGRRIHPLDGPVPDCMCGRYFPETGHVIAGRFLTYWEANGGLAQFGYPLTEQITETLEDGKPYTVQYFERARFELHPENPAPYDLLLGQFGRRIYEQLGR
jgi:hypothetical protein